MKGGRRPGRVYVIAAERDCGWRRPCARYDVTSGTWRRMFGPRGNPQARNLFGVIGYLQRQAGVEFRVTAGAG